LAKDGIYLHQAPRKINKIYLTSGSRADVAIRCECQRGGALCNSRIHWQAIHSVIGLGATAPNLAQGEYGTLMKIAVSNDAKKELKRDEHVTLKRLPRFEVRRPCYLADLRKAVVKKENKHTLELPVGGVQQYEHATAHGEGTEMFKLRVKWDGQGKVFRSVNPLSPPVAHLTLGNVYEIWAWGVKYHPLHIHVMPFQIVKGGKGLNSQEFTSWFGDGSEDYFQDGDWQDTLLSPGHNNATLRIMPERFHGKYLIHCHILEHEDNGMMTWINMTGKEGTLCPQAEKISPTCFRDDNPEFGYIVL